MTFRRLYEYHVIVIPLDDAPSSSWFVSFEHRVHHLQYVPSFEERVELGNQWRDYPLQEEQGWLDSQLMFDNNDFLRIRLCLWLIRMASDEEQRLILVTRILQEICEGVSDESSPVLPRPSMMVYIEIFEIVCEVTPSVEPGPLLERAMLESMMEHERRNCCGMVPTKREAQVVECVEVDVDGGSDECCVVCLEDMKGTVGSLPCRHLFHSDCILQWLKTSHYCPVCRYELPTEDPVDIFGMA